ncbi:FkbM family methyltransferase [Tabrizicola sp. J26]|uniref:FkbM family methyltransferase n=1 Tax=Alitabrizicola rongguiensis TaxID=2909234 RepID=UPI001EFF6C4E|nr:FkbM family methyltransferase [Tabrizicola rongguiensis]MCF1708455.1 FkbM family methyltransferase [Tabrizicola rongguiensis]
MEQMGTAEPPQVVATFHGVTIPAAPHLTPRMIRSMDEGRYERPEVMSALATITTEDRVLEFGAGSGAVGAAIALNCQPKALLSFEANPDLVPHARSLHQLNGLSDRMELRHGVVLSDPDAPSGIEFLVRGNFLGSGLELARGVEKARRVPVPVWRYADVKREFPHEVIVMDIEGGELAFLRHADLTGVRLVLLELHPGLYGEVGMRGCRRALRRAGFEADRELSRRMVFVYRRKVA